ncbi:MAG: polysulfide reductase NrfD [Acidobacteria bacterium]|nr:polysulfide reductase NrfD [Acidobacteriota bacterium]MDW7983141.1 NrfD/PsrC family molybdoenzyme membrane anchor subunit [Acidobacteriota bacterium]
MAAYGRIHADVLRTLAPPGRGYYTALALVGAVLAWALYAWSVQLARGLGVAGYRGAVQWAVYITNFVFWIGIAHSGTLISAILYLFRARWRAAISRTSEAMTVFAVLTAGLFPIIHLGRPWYFYWLIPYPNQRGLWVNFRSPLIWDVFAVGTYFMVSAVFLYVGLIPDLAALRERTAGWRRRVYQFLSLGWRGTQEEWRHYRSAYLLLAALATPLVVSVHSVVSWDFAMALVPGWHSTIFAPYFVAGAILSGLAMVLTLTIPLRRLLGLKDYITDRHLENVAKLIVVTSLIVTYAYGCEFFIAGYSGNAFEQAVFRERALGTYAPLFWLMVFCNSVVPLTLLVRQVRTHVWALWVIALLINVGMWLERFIIITGSLSFDYEPWYWADAIYRPRWVEYSIMAGGFAWFFLGFLLFVKHFPVIPMAEVKAVLGRRSDELGS